MPSPVSKGSAPSRVEAIAKVLWEDWDPIGVNEGRPYGHQERGCPSDEYDMYAPDIAALLDTGAASEVIAAHLSEIAVKRMGFRHAELTQKFRPVAQKLLSLKEQTES